MAVAEVEAVVVPDAVAEVETAQVAEVPEKNRDMFRKGKAGKNRTFAQLFSKLSITGNNKQYVTAKTHQIQEATKRQEYGQCR